MYYKVNICHFYSILIYIHFVYIYFRQMIKQKQKAGNIQENFFCKIKR